MLVLFAALELAVAGHALAVRGERPSTRVSSSSGWLAGRRVWPVALSGLVSVRSRFCRQGAICGVGDPATAIDANGGGSPSVYYRDGLLYVWFVGGPERPIFVIDRAGRIVRTVRPPNGIVNLAVDSRGVIFLTPSVKWFIQRIDRVGHVSRYAGRYPTITWGQGTCRRPCGEGRPVDRHKAVFSQIIGLDIDSHDRLLVADTEAVRIRRIDGDGLVRTIAGSGIGPGDRSPPCRYPCRISDGKPARQMVMFFPAVVKAETDDGFWFTENSGDFKALQMLWHVDPKGVAHLIDPHRAAAHGIDPTTGDAVIVQVDRLNQHPQLVEISPTRRHRPLLGSPTGGCASTRVALTCGDGFAAPRASLNGAMNYSLSSIAVDEQGGVFFASQGEEIRYLAPANAPSARLGFALTSSPITTPHGAPVTFAFQASEAVMITARLQLPGNAPPRGVAITQSGDAHGHVTWDGTIDATRAPSGSYVLELLASDTSGRTSSRSIPITVS